MCMIISLCIIIDRGTILISSENLSKFFFRLFFIIFKLFSYYIRIFYIYICIIYIVYYFSRKMFKYYDLNKKSYFILKNFIAFENNYIILILMVNMSLIISCSLFIYY